MSEDMMDETVDEQAQQQPQKPVLRRTIAGETLKARKDRRGWGLKAALASGALVMVCIAAYMFLGSGMFEVREVKFTGNKYVTAARLMQVMGLRRGNNIFGLSSRDVAARLMSNPWVKDAKIRKRLPHRIEVKIEEAVPLSLLQRPEGIYAVDASGNLLEETDEDAHKALPVIIDPNATRPAGLSSPLLLASAVLDKRLVAREGRISISGFESGAENLTLSVDGLSVKVGEGEYKEKLSRLIEISEEIAKRNITVSYVDLRFNDRVVVKAVEETADAKSASNKKADTKVAMHVTKNRKKQ